MKKGNTKKKNIIKPGTFFAVYFAFFTVILLWNLFHCTEVSWNSADAFLEESGETGAQAYAGSSADEKQTGKTKAPLELRDDRSFTARAAQEQDESNSSANLFGKKPRLRGLALLGYMNKRSLLFSDETVTAEVVDIRSKEVVGSGTLLLKNQTIYPNDETNVYIALSEPVTQMLPKDLEIRVHTSGLTRNGIFFTGGTAEQGGESPLVRLYYEKKKWNPVMPLLYYALEILTGLGGLLLYRGRKLPLLRKERAQQLPETGASFAAAGSKGKTAAGGRIREQAGKYTVPALVLLFVFVLMLYTYVHVIKKTADACDADLLTGGSRAEDVVRLSPGMTLRQSVIAGKDRLSGFGIRLVSEDGKTLQSVKKASYAEAVLEWALLDESGTAVLTSGTGQVKDLKKASASLSMDITDKMILKAAEASFELQLDSIVREAAGKRFVLQIKYPAQNGEEEDVFLLATGDTNGRIETATGNVTDFSGGGQEQKTLSLELCLMGVCKSNGFIKGMYLRICAAVLIVLAGLYYVMCRFSRPGPGAGKQAAAMYLASALCMGMVFSFMTPAYTISDERTHIDSVYILSNRILGISDLPGPKRLLKRACDIDSSIANTMPVTAERYRAVDENLFGAAPEPGAAAKEKTGEGADRDTPDKDISENVVPDSAVSDNAVSDGAVDVSAFSGRELTPAYTRNALDNVPVLCYLPSAVGFTAARLLRRNMITMIMAARWLNLLACVLIMYFAVRRMPYGAAAMAVIGLFPKTLQQMASCSYDGMVIAGTFLFIALSLTAAFDEDVCIADLLGLILSGLLVAACKGGAYLPVLGMAFMIPAVRAGKGKKMQTGWLVVGGAAVGAAALLFLGKYVSRLIGMFGRESGTATIAAGTKTLYTLSDFIQSPVKLARIYINTVLVRGDGLVGELVGKNLSQKWYIVYAFLLLALLGMLRKSSVCREPGAGAKQDLSRREPGAGPEQNLSRREPGAGPEQNLSRRETQGDTERNHFRLPGKLWLLFLTAGSIALVFLSMLLAFTQKGEAYIDGLQGRYFLPVAPLPFLAAENGLVRRDGIEDAALLYAADVLLAVTFMEILLTCLGGV